MFAQASGQLSASASVPRGASVREYHRGQREDSICHKYKRDTKPAAPTRSKLLTSGTPDVVPLVLLLWSLDM